MPVDVEAAVIANRRLSADYNVLSLAAPEIARHTRPGQFVMIKTTGGGDPLLRRPFSVFEILRGPSREPIGISIFNKRIGVGTTLLSRVEAGARLACLGPLGHAFQPVSRPAEAWMIAGGVGLAPFVTLAESLAANGVRTTLFYGARRADELYCVELFDAFSVSVVLATEDGSRGIHGRVTLPLERALAARDAADPVTLYACGPTPMMRACAMLAARYGRACEVSLEQTMGCGLGGCYSCVAPVRSGDGPPHHMRTCVDGPVLAADRVVWDAIRGH
ncbi:MAG: dihydroorotate dehydrogenase electron transfer subunit [Vicinamibacterales bacterium]